MTKRDDAIKALRPYVTSGLGAIFASSCVHPMDLIKVRIQVSSTINAAGGHAPTGIVPIMSKIYSNEGFRGFYHGVSASFARQAVYGTARMGLHDSFSKQLKIRNGGKPLPFYQKTLSAMTAGAIAGLLGNPFDLSLVRMEADGCAPPNLKRGYHGVFDAVYRIGKEEGLKTLWRGSVPMVCRAISVNVGMLVSNDTSKELMIPYLGDGMTTSVLASAISGLVSSFTSLPFDLMKTRLMNMSADANGVYPYKNLGDCFIQILKKEGFLKFWKGYGAYAARTAPHSMICLLMKDVLTSAYDRVLLPRK